MSEIRRVVTARDADNKAVVLFDSRLPLKPGKTANPGAILWMTDRSPAGFSQQDAAKRPLGIAPPDNGSVIRVVEFLPTDNAALAEMSANFMSDMIGDKTPARGLATSHPLMHRTRTVDYAVVIAGEIDMMLDDTALHLRAGDVVVQQATNHAWINRGSEPCRIVFVLMDAEQP